MFELDQVRDQNSRHSLGLKMAGDSLNLELQEATAIPEISIVATMYRSRPFLERFLAECLQGLAELECVNFEIVLVNDGSPDDSLAYALSRRQDIPQLVVVDLSRNFGHHYAMQAGLRYSRGESIFLIDCDLEISPLVLPEFQRKLTFSCSDMVYGYQEEVSFLWNSGKTNGEISKSQSIKKID